MMCKAIRGQVANNPALEKLLPHIKGNVGLVFTKEDPILVRDKLLENKVWTGTRISRLVFRYPLLLEFQGISPWHDSFN